MLDYSLIPTAKPRRSTIYMSLVLLTNLNPHSATPSTKAISSGEFELSFPVSGSTITLWQRERLRINFSIFKHSSSLEFERRIERSD